MCYNFINIIRERERDFILWFILILEYFFLIGDFLFGVILII